MAERFEYVPLDQIKVQKHNVRIHEIDQGIEDLAESIRANGLLQPIAAYRDSDESGYVILTGQRRLQAYHHLNEKYPGKGFDRIQCKIIDEPESDAKKKALSLAENITQLTMINTDTIKAVTDLFNVYNDYDLVRQEFGLTRYMVDKYVRLARLPEELKAAIQNGEIHPNPKTAENMAIKAVDATNYTKNGPVPVQTVIDLAKEMAKGENSARDIAAEVKKGGSVRDIVNRSKKIPKSKLKLDLSQEIAIKLQKVAESSGETENSLASQYIESGVNRDFKQMDD